MWKPLQKTFFLSLFLYPTAAPKAIMGRTPLIILNFKIYFYIHKVSLGLMESCLIFFYIYYYTKHTIVVISYIQILLTIINGIYIPLT